METGLLPVNSGLSDSVESKLLETMSIVNDDDDVVMTNGLLDLELDAMILSQSTPSTSVSRVPHKTVRDFQAMKRRFSQKLYCKDQHRSNNISALLDTIRAPTPTGMPPLEMAWDLEPTHTLPVLSVTSRKLPHALETKPCWTAPETEHLILQKKGDANNTTFICDSSTSRLPAGCRSIYHTITSQPSVPAGSTPTTVIEASTYYELLHRPYL